MGFFRRSLPGIFPELLECRFCFFAHPPGFQRLFDGAQIGEVVQGRRAKAVQGGLGKFRKSRCQQPCHRHLGIIAGRVKGMHLRQHRGEILLYQEKIQQHAVLPKRASNSFLLSQYGWTNWNTRSLFFCANLRLEQKLSQIDQLSISGIKERI